MARLQHKCDLDMAWNVPFCGLMQVNARLFFTRVCVVPVEADLMVCVVCCVFVFVAFVCLCFGFYIFALCFKKG